jgi:hypothetical protein
MLPRPARFYHPDADQRVAVLAASPTADRDLFVIELERGPSAVDLTTTATYGPFERQRVAGEFADLVQSLRDQGYWPASVLAHLEALDSPNPAQRARAALRLGWRRSVEAVPKLLALLPGSVDDLCSMIDALGAIGDARAIPGLRPHLTRKLLSRRRSAVEALRILNDAVGLAIAQQLGLDRLPPMVKALVESPGGAGPIVDAVKGLPQTQQGLAADTLYELATPLTVAAARQFLEATPVDQVHVWRYAKSIFKRSQLRHDPVMFGWLSHAIEARGQETQGHYTTVKSGYDGKDRKTRIFGRHTQYHVRRGAWRYLNDLALFRPELYVPAAAEALIHYTTEETATGRLGGCYLLHHILWGQSNRLVYVPRSLIFHVRHQEFAPPPEREESYPELWDEQPRAYLRLLAAARSTLVQTFALNSVEARHPNLIQEATHTEIVALLAAPYEQTVQLGLAELERRFDPDQPDWDLLYVLLTDERPPARTLGQRWLRLTAMHWLGNVDRIVRFLALPHPNQRALVAELVIAALHTNRDLRELLAPRLLALLGETEPSPGAHDGYARVVQEALAEECNAHLTVAELARWLEHGSPSAQIAAGHLLAVRPGAVAELGLDRLARLTQHEMVAVRSAAQGLLRKADAALRADPSILFLLVESDWDDTRQTAFDLLRTRIDIAALGLDGFMGLLDSNRTDVQDLGAELVRKHFGSLPMAELVRRLVQHPHPHMRPFALELVTDHLPAGADALQQLHGFCRSALFDLWPQAAVKRRLVEFLSRRALQDEAQATLVAAMLGDLVRVQGRADFERAMEALVRIKLAFPTVPATVSVAAKEAV